MLKDEVPFAGEHDGRRQQQPSHRDVHDTEQETVPSVGGADRECSHAVGRMIIQLPSASCARAEQSDEYDQYWLQVVFLCRLNTKLRRRIHRVAVPDLGAVTIEVGPTVLHRDPCLRKHLAVAIRGSGQCIALTAHGPVFPVNKGVFLHHAFSALSLTGDCGGIQPLLAVREPLLEFRRGHISRLFGRCAAHLIVPFR